MTGTKFVDHNIKIQCLEKFWGIRYYYHYYHYYYYYYYYHHHHYFGRDAQQSRYVFFCSDCFDFKHKFKQKINKTFIMKNVVLFTRILLIFIWISSCDSIEEKCDFREKTFKTLSKYSRNALRNYNNSLYKKFVTMVTMSIMIFILKIVNAY